MKSLATAMNAAVIGASGGIGQAVLQCLNDDPSVERIHAFSRNATSSVDGKAIEY